MCAVHVNLNPHLSLPFTMQLYFMCSSSLAASPEILPCCLHSYLIIFHLLLYLLCICLHSFPHCVISLRWRRLTNYFYQVFTKMADVIQRCNLWSYVGLILFSHECCILVWKVSEGNNLKFYEKGVIIVTQFMHEVRERCLFLTIFLHE